MWPRGEIVAGNVAEVEKVSSVPEISVAKYKIIWQNIISQPVNKSFHQDWPGGCFEKEIDLGHTTHY